MNVIYMLCWWSQILVLFKSKYLEAVYQSNLLLHNANSSPSASFNQNSSKHLNVHWSYLIAWLLAETNLGSLCEWKLLLYSQMRKFIVFQFSKCGREIFLQMTILSPFLEWNIHCPFLFYEENLFLKNLHMVIFL